MFGAENAMANNYLKGSWDWTESDAGTYIFVDGYASVVLAASTSYQFGVLDSDKPNEGGTFYKRSITISSTATDVVFTSTDNNCTLQTGVAGKYIFKVTWYQHDDSKWYPHLDVYFPEEYEPRTGLTIGNFGTICMTKEAPIADITGAEFYSIYGKDAETPTELYLVKEEDKLVAGRPYIFKATATTISTKLIGAPTSEGNYHGLYGTFETSLSVESTVEEPLYILSNNTVVKAGSGCSITNGRAYIKMNEVSVTAAPSAPSAIRLDLEENNATSIETIEASEKAVKFIENGQMYILRGGIKYDATGRVVK